LAIAVDKKGVKWFGTNKGLSSFDDTNWKTFTTVNGLADNTVNCIAVDKYNQKWIGTINGVSKLVENSVATYDEQISYSEVVLYPNPANTTISFQNLPEANHYNISIKNIEGKEILKTSLSSASESIDIATLMSGFYIVTIQTADKFITKKLVKQ
jgi:Secretion system C-terminal sorting domain